MRTYVLVGLLRLAFCDHEKALNTCDLLSGSYDTYNGACLCYVPAADYYRELDFCGVLVDTNGSNDAVRVSVTVQVEG